MNLYLVTHIYLLEVSAVVMGHHYTCLGIAEIRCSRNEINISRILWVNSYAVDSQQSLVVLGYLITEAYPLLSVIIPSVSAAYVCSCVEKSGLAGANDACYKSAAADSDLTV